MMTLVYQDQLYFTLAATGEFCVAGPAAGTYEVVVSKHVSDEQADRPCGGHGPFDRSG